MSGEESVERRLVVREWAIPQSCDRVSFMYLNVGGVAKDDVFEKMSLVASQLPLTREPRKECEAKDSAELAWIVKTVRLGAVKLRKSGKAVGSAEGERSLSLATDIVQPYRDWGCRAGDLCFVFELGEAGYCAVQGGVALTYGFGYRIWTKRHRQIIFSR